MSDLKQVEPLEQIEEVMRQLPQGAFLTVKEGDRSNTMTIGWAVLGIIWSRPVMTVAVRKTRYTYELIEKAPDFTVSVPAQDEFADELMVCGTKSGRECNKFTQCGLQVRQAQQVESPLIELPGLHFECRILLRAPMEPARMHPDLAKVYPAQDYHTFYYGSVEAAYRLD